MAERTKKQLYFACFIGASVLTVLGLVKAVFVSLDIDESYLVACAYRIAAGDGMFSEMWEPHQLASILPAFFALLYTKITGSATGIVLFFRILSLLIHLPVGAALYRFLVKRLGKIPAAALFLLHINFLPKWVQSLDFELMTYWALLLMMLLLWDASEKEGKGSILRFAASGILLVISMLSYPSFLLLYPVFVIGILKCCPKESRIKNAVCFTLGSLLSGFCVIGFIVLSSGSPDLLSDILRVFFNPSHATQSLQERLLSYLLEVLKVLPIWFPATAASLLILRRRIPGAKKEELLISSMLLSFLVFQVTMLFGCIFFDKNQFFLQGRYVALLLPALIIFRKKQEWCRPVFWFAYLPGIAASFCVMLLTNMTASVAWSKSMPAVMASLYVLACGYASFKDSFSEEEPVKKADCKHILLGASYVLTLLGLFLCRLLLLRVTGCLPVTVRAPLERIENGPAKGIYILKDFADSANREFTDLEGLYTGNEKVLYVGAEMLVYLDHPCRISSPSTEGTTVYDEYFLEYYRLFPEKLPDLVIVDKHYAEVPEYARYLTEYVTDTWIAENYLTVVKETPDLLILRR